MSSWDTTRNTFSTSQTRTPVASATRTATGNSGTLNASFVAFDFLVTSTAVVGAGTFTITVEESSDGTTWTAISGADSGAISTVQAAARVRGLVTRPYYRVVWTKASGTSLTFSVSGPVK